MTARYPAFRLLFLPILLVLFGCSEQPEGDDAMAVEMPVMETMADTVAMKVYEAYGGPEAWQQLRYLRFNFGGAENPVRHFWDRSTGDYRVEMPSGEDTTYVALFNVNTREGAVYLDGEELPAAQEEEMLNTAYRRFINDTYWLLMPVKLFDPGVNLSYVADSSNAERDVLHLSFGEVGLTPAISTGCTLTRRRGWLSTGPIAFRVIPRITCLSRLPGQVTRRSRRRTVRSWSRRRSHATALPCTRTMSPCPPKHR